MDHISERASALARVIDAPTFTGNKVAPMRIGIP